MDPARDLTASQLEAWNRGSSTARAATVAAGVGDFRDYDLAKVGPCPGCGVSVRRFASVPVKGHGLDASPADAAHCPVCLAAPACAAADEVRARQALEVQL